jgi:hypothetical protein
MANFIFDVIFTSPFTTHRLSYVVPPPSFCSACLLLREECNNLIDFQYKCHDNRILRIPCHFDISHIPANSQISQSDGGVHRMCHRILHNLEYNRSTSRPLGK